MGGHVSRKDVELLMREADLADVSPRRKGKSFTRHGPKAALPDNPGEPLETFNAPPLTDQSPG